MATTEKTRLERRIRTLISKLSKLVAGTAEFVSITTYLLGILRELNDQPSHSKWFVEERQTLVEKVEVTYGIAKPRR